MDEKESTDDAGKPHFDPLNKKKKVGNYLLGKIIGEGAFAKIRQGLHIIAREKVKSYFRSPRKALSQSDNQTC